MKPAHKLLHKNNLHNSHWGLRIIAAENLGEFTDEDESLASLWISCACGKLDSHVQINSNGEPEDTLLSNLGVEFSDWVKVIPDGWLIGITNNVNDEFHGAAVTLVQIEQRSLELLKES